MQVLQGFFLSYNVMDFIWKSMVRAKRGQIKIKEVQQRKMNRNTIEKAIERGMRQICADHAPPSALECSLWNLLQSMYHHLLDLGALWAGQSSTVLHLPFTSDYILNPIHVPPAAPSWRTGQSSTTGCPKMLLVPLCTYSILAHCGKLYCTSI